MAQLDEKPQMTAMDVATLLLVDDDPNHREIYQRRLERRGYRVRLAESADEAVAAMQESTPPTRPSASTSSPGWPMPTSRRAATSSRC